MPFVRPRSPYPPHWADHFGHDFSAAELIAAARQRSERLDDFLRWESLRLYNYADLDVMAAYAAQIEAEAHTPQGGCHDAH